MGSAGGTDSEVEWVILGGGCFWCLEPIFGGLPGVMEVVAGYAGGELPNPTYEQVCSGISGHAEVVQIQFDPRQISYRDLLYHFFAIHNPTTLNRQGNDRGSQYRSVIFYHNDKQRQVAEAVVAELDVAALWDSPIVTEIAPAPEFFRAENYHQHYFELHPDQPYCQVVIAPKVAKFRASLRR